ncbi:MAG: hypothetical protein J0I10_08575 [Verrucomicrobia bacterium]|nr:hypothetical protein [Verrucomicrobiota bacterium]
MHPSAQRELSPSSRHPLHLAPFSHLDLFWGGTREECLSRGNEIISRALDLLERHEDFTFLIETANFLHHYVDCYPGERERIARLAASGRLELAPIWSAIYQNLPGGETLARNALYAKRYVRRQFNIDPQTVHFADLPGYTPQYPQIARLAGIQNLVMSRGGPSATPLFIWKGMDGTRILSYYTTQGYAVMAVSQDWHKDYADVLAKGAEKNLRETFSDDSYPQFTQWGCDLYAPNENLILNIRRWNEDKTDFPVIFSTPSGYFREVSSLADLPVLTGEIASAWPNIESCWPDMWPEDLPCEHALQMAEFLSTFCLLRGWQDYPAQQLEMAWRALLDGMDHNQDAQGGSTADRDKLRLKQYSRLISEQITDRMAWRLASGVSAPRKFMAPLVVFNSQSWRRAGVVVGRIAVYGEARSCDVEEFKAGTRLVNDRGEVVPYVPLCRYEGLSMTMEVAFPADEIPSSGYRTWYFEPGSNPLYESATCRVSPDGVIEGRKADPRRNFGCDVYENAFFRLTLDRVTGEVSIEDLRHGRPLLEKMSIVGVEERGGNYIANMTPSGRTFPPRFHKIEMIDNNAVWCRLRLEGSVAETPFSQVITLYRDFPEIRLENEIEWGDPYWVRIQQVFPYAGEGDEIRYGVPFGQVSYPGTMPSAQGELEDEIPREDREGLRLCRHWVDIGDHRAGVTIGCDHRMWEMDGRTLRSYMVRGISHSFVVKRSLEGETSVISRPPPGRYRFTYIIRPREHSLAQSASYRCGWELNHPVRAVAGDRSGNGVFPERDELFDFSETSFVSTAFKQAEDGGGIVLRAFESTGAESSLPLPELEGYSVKETDILEQQRAAPTMCRPFEIKTLVFEKDA